MEALAARAVSARAWTGQDNDIGRQRMRGVGPVTEGRAQAPAEWPLGGGSLGELTRRFDWSTTSLGPIADWPLHLKIKVNSIVNSPIPQVLMWGPRPHHALQ